MLGPTQVVVIDPSVDVQSMVFENDGIIINFHDSENAIGEVYKEAIIAFREKLIDKLQKGQEMPRRITFASVDISVKENEQFLLHSDDFEYPEIVMLMRNILVPFNYNQWDGLTDAERIENLSNSFLA